MSDGLRRDRRGSRDLRDVERRIDDAARAASLPGGCADSDAIVRLVGVSRVYGEGETAVTALVGVDLEIAAGELVAVMGASGSGKSTLLSIAGGLQPPSSGEVIVEGRALSRLDARATARLRRRSLGFVFQDFNLIPTLTAIENVTLPLELDGESARRARRQAQVALDAVGLEAKHDAYPDDLSGGQQQRIAIARAVVGGRRLILADEPTGALDSVTGEAVMRMLRARVDDGAAAILVTHEARHAAWADRIVFLRDGRIVDESRRDSTDALLGGIR
ncbi:ABC transporter ATP-binding protein [Microbacterium karelineae]|uniref:ABC transporter ATP-binding protein n=1 Tax=Microbacterium karelineae TaxID=2654283 RepID=UPI0012EA1E97|nr:ABC transporter ATP-binding protein [Microbacterium karelineae]